MTEFINQWLFQMGIAPILGAALIAVMTVVAAIIMRFLSDEAALALSRWSRLGIRTQLFDIIRRPLWMSVVLLGVLVEVRWLLPPPPLDFWIVGATNTVLAIVWMIVLVRTLGLVCSRLTGYYPGAPELFRLIQNVGVVLIVIMVGLMILSVWQINLTPLVASAGLAGIIVALAAKDILGNFFGGISVFLDRPFRPGDYIVLNSGERGKVVDIGLRSTRILTRDDVLISVPNSVIVNTKIINESAPARIMRVRVKVSIANTADVDKAKDVFLEVAGANPLVLSDPKPRLRFRSFGDGSLDFELLCWTANPKDKGRLIHQLNTALFKAMNEAEIAFPFARREVFVHHIPDTGAKPDQQPSAR